MTFDQLKNIVDSQIQSTTTEFNLALKGSIEAKRDSSFVIYFSDIRRNELNGIKCLIFQFRLNEIMDESEYVALSSKIQAAADDIFRLAIEYKKPQ